MFQIAGCPILFAHFAKRVGEGIIGALYERARCKSQREIPRGRQPWNPTLQKTKGGAPGNGDLNEYGQIYREAYCNGYQQAYYRETENIEAAIFSEANAPE